MTQQDEIEIEQRPLVRRTTRRTVWILLAANVLTYGVIWVGLHAMAAK